MKKTLPLLGWRQAIAVASVVMTTTTAMAVPYASGVRNTGGSTWEFVLNEAADEVVINRDGGSPVTIAAPAAGRYTFDMSGFTGFDIAATKSAATGWTEISDQTNLFTKFFRPSGLVVNQNPNTDYFGTVYVANSRVGTTSGDNVRDSGDGVYSLTADLQGADLATAGWTVPDPQDVTQAKVGAGWDVSASNGIWRLALDDSGNLLAGDWSDAAGGVKYTGPDLTGGGLVLAVESGPTYGVIDPNGPFDGSASPFTHGSIIGVPNVTGTVGVDLVLSAMDEDLNRNPIGFLDGTYPNASLPDTNEDGNPTDGNHVWQWNLGTETNSFIKPELLIDVGGSPAPEDNQLGSDSSGRPYFLDLNIGVRADAEFFPQIGDNGLWILTQPRNDGNESGIVIVEVDETGTNEPEVVWASRQWTIDNDLDSYPGEDGGATLPDDPNNDVFRGTGTVEVSPDGTALYVHRRTLDSPGVGDVNPYTGIDSPLPGGVLVVPLDADGVPEIVVDDNGTPGDTSDDLLTNLQSIENVGGPLTTENYDIEVDAAGNIYIVDNASELLQVFSPGGDTTTTFSFDGTTRSFSTGGSVDPGLAGDANGDGNVDLLDLDILGANFGTMGGGMVSTGDFNGDGNVDLLDLDILGGNFGASNNAVSVPEPASAIVVISALAALSVGRRRS